MKTIISLFFIFLIFACSNKESKSVESVIEIDYPDQESWNTVLTITNNGNKVGVVEANHLKKYSKKNVTLISDGLKVDFFNAQGKHTSVLTSEGGRVNDVKQDMLAYGNVIVVSDSGMTLYTDTLKWDNKRQKIISEIPVKITSESDTLYGDSFISDPSLENYEITNSHGSGTEMIRKKL